MVREVLTDHAGAVDTRPVTALERATRWGHAGAVLRLNAPSSVAHALERALLRAGVFVVHPPDDDPTTPGVLAAAGALVLETEESDDGISLRIGSSHAESVIHGETAKAVSSLLRLLRESNVLHQERTR